MDNKCNGCGAAIFDISYIQCSRERCKKLYHLKCVTLSTEKLEALGEEYKCQWTCPECACTIPKTDNSDTPVRGNAFVSKTNTPCYVNTERGSGRKNKDIQPIDNKRVLEELLEFRMEMKYHMEDHMKEISVLKERYMNTETELKDVRKVLETVLERANKVDMLENKIKELMERNAYLERFSKVNETKNSSNLKEQSSYALAVKQSQGRGDSTKPDGRATKLTSSDYEDKNKIIINSIRDNDKTSNMVKSSKNDIPNIIEKDERNERGNWTQVNKKRSKYPNSEVQKGGNLNMSGIQGTERMKYLHIWRLQKDTQTENVEKHVRNICGQEIPIKVDKIKHKTERDYASFIVGIPESKYDMICHPESWAVNIEFCEWVWFRRPIQKQT